MDIIDVERNVIKMLIRSMRSDYNESRTLVLLDVLREAFEWSEADINGLKNDIINENLEMD